MNDNDTKDRIDTPPPRPGDARAQWLLSSASSAGNSTIIMTSQYEELRGLARAQAKEIAELRERTSQIARISAENLQLANRAFACESESARLRKLLHDTEHIARRMISRDSSTLFELLDKIAKED